MNTKSGIEVSVVLPCYNENAHISDSLPKIISFLEETYDAGCFEVILVDDKSTDGTREYLASFANSDGVRVLLNEKNLGRGGAVLRGLAAARGEIAGYMDIDREVSEVYLAQFVEKVMSGSDLVVGVRSFGRQTRPGAVLRYLASKCYRRLCRLLLRPAVTDTEAGYKFFSRRARELILAESSFTSWFWDTEAVMLCQFHEYSVAEVPVLFCRNPLKRSSVRLWRDVPEYLLSMVRFKRLSRTKC